MSVLDSEAEKMKEKIEKLLKGLSDCAPAVQISPGSIDASTDEKLRETLQKMVEAFCERTRVDPLNPDFDLLGKLREHADLLEASAVLGTISALQRLEPRLRLLREAGGR